MSQKEELILKTTKLLSGMNGEPKGELRNTIYKHLNYGPITGLVRSWNQSKEKAEQIHEGYEEAIKEAGRFNENFMLHLVDIVWNDVTESTAVPSTDHAKKLIKKAGESLNLKTKQEHE